MEITTARVVNSTELELVLLSYEIIIDDINKNLDGMKDSRKVELTNAKNFLRNLRDALDRKYELSKNLSNLYDYVASNLVSAEITTSDERKEKALKDSLMVMEKLYEAWKKINEENEHAERAMTNTDVIYSGLTYGKGGLNETVLGNWNKGLKA